MIPPCTKSFSDGCLRIVLFNGRANNNQIYLRANKCTRVSSLNLIILSRWTTPLCRRDGRKCDFGVKHCALNKSRDRLLIPQTFKRFSCLRVQLVTSNGLPAFAGYWTNVRSPHAARAQRYEESSAKGKRKEREYRGTMLQGRAEVSFARKIAGHR